jgi:hypothetical protein
MGWMHPSILHVVHDYSPSMILPKSFSGRILHSFGGKNRDATASDDPIKVIHTMDTADGTRTAKSGKCNDANKYPKALLFMANSMANVRHTSSP